MLGNEVAPAGVSQADGHPRGVDDVRADDGGQDPVAATYERATERAHPCEVVDDARLVAKNPGIVTGLDLEDHSRADLHLEPVGREEPQPAGHHDAEVVVLARVRQRDRLDVI